MLIFIIFQKYILMQKYNQLSLSTSRYFFFFLDGFAFCIACYTHGQTRHRKSSTYELIITNLLDAPTILYLYYSNHFFFFLTYFYLCIAYLKWSLTNKKNLKKLKGERSFSFDKYGGSGW